MRHAEVIMRELLAILVFGATIQGCAPPCDGLIGTHNGTFSGEDEGDFLLLMATGNGVDPAVTGTFAGSLQSGALYGSTVCLDKDTLNLVATMESNDDYCAGTADGTMTIAGGAGTWEVQCDGGEEFGGQWQTL